MRFQLEDATDGRHKYVGVFTDDNNKVLRVPFGAKGYEDYTQHGNRVRRSLYLARHRVREDWNNPYSAGALSKHLLWGDTSSLRQNIELFKRRFRLV